MEYKYRCCSTTNINSIVKNLERAKMLGSPTMLLVCKRLALVTLLHPTNLDICLLHLGHLLVLRTTKLEMALKHLKVRGKSKEISGRRSPMRNSRLKVKGTFDESHRDSTADVNTYPPGFWI